MKNSTIGYMICETAATPKDAEIKVIDETKSGKVVIEAILQDLEVKNRNGRWYGLSDLSPEITSDRTQELVDSGNFKGENGHPMSKDIARQQTIEPKYVCCKYTKLWLDGRDVKAHVRGTNNQAGAEFDADIRDGEKPSFSLRALGTVENTARGAEVKNVKIITYDRVIYPSHKRAYMTNIVSESTILNNCNENKIVLQENDKGLFVPINNQQVIDYIKTESCNIKNIVESFEFIYDDITLLENGNVQLTDKEGTTFVVHLETYIEKEISDYCSKM